MNQVVLLHSTAMNVNRGTQKAVKVSLVFHTNCNNSQQRQNKWHLYKHFFFLLDIRLD